MRAGDLNMPGQAVTELPVLISKPPETWQGLNVTQQEHLSHLKGVPAGRSLMHIQVCLCTLFVCSLFTLSGLITAMMQQFNGVSRRADGLKGHEVKQ